MSLQEFENAPDGKTRRYIMMRSITDFGMGALYLGIGAAVIFSKYFNLPFENLNNPPAKFFGGLAFIYGAWRIYRGIKKDYFKS